MMNLGISSAVNQGYLPQLFFSSLRMRDLNSNLVRVSVQIFSLSILCQVTMPGSQVVLTGLVK